MEFLDLRDEQLAYDDTGDRTLVLRHEFQPTGVYLDSATYGLPPKVALQALSAVTAAWASGRYDPVSCDQAVAGARSTFARVHSVSAADVAIGHQVSPMVGLIAASLPPPARVLAAEGDFTSLLFPLLPPAVTCARSRSSGSPTRSTAAPTWWPSQPSNPQTDGSPIWMLSPAQQPVTTH
jgi:hypothetical protein